MKDYKEESRQHFNRQAKEYDENTSFSFSYAGKVSCEDVRKYLKDIPFEKLLDVGSGTGWLIDHLSKEHNAKFDGIDISENMLEKAKSKNIKNATFCLGQSDKLPYEDESFDVVTCVQSFHHYPDQEKAMKEVFRVLKKGGLYIISDTGWGGLLAWIDNNILIKIVKTGDCKITNKKGLSRKMEENGFKVIRSEKLKFVIYTVVGKKE